MIKSSNPTQVKPTFVSIVNRLVYGIARHWLTIFNTLWGLYVLFPLLAPILMATGLTTPARIIYSVYSFACHQLPDHSYFFFGSHLTPSLSQLEAAGMPSGLNFFQQRLFLGNDQIGFKSAICQRDIAIYGAVFLGGIAYSYWGQRGRRIRWYVYILLLAPMAIDGTTQLIGLRESNWWLRTLTGMLFGLATVWFAYPHIQGAMDEALDEQMIPLQ
ncbi:MAG: DUF2085 domain-containing protein [Chloroflexota bacterium]